MNKVQEDVLRTRIIEVLQWLSCEVTNNEKQYTTHDRWDRIYPFLKDLGWKYRRGGLDGFVYQPPRDARWMSCEAAAIYFESTLPVGVKLVERLVSKERGTTSMQQVLSVANRKKRAVKASTVNESVLPNPLVSSASSVLMKEPISTTLENVVQSLPSVEVRSSRVGILKRGFKSRKRNINVLDSQDTNSGTFVQEPLAAAVTATVVPDGDVYFADPIPGPPEVEDKEGNVVDNRRRTPKRKGRPNEFVMREQLDSTSEDEVEVDCASPESSDASSRSDDGSVHIRSKSSSRTKKVCTTQMPYFIFLTSLIPNTASTA
jgi:hypothetical protein